MTGGTLRRLFGGSTGPVLIYGEAGAGKTNLVLDALREASAEGRRGVYVSTEGSQYAARASALGGLDNVLFAEAGSLAEQTRIVLMALPGLVEPGDVVAVDTINSLYRLELGGRDEAARAFAHMGAQMAVLRGMADRGVRVVVAGQVHGEGEEASGMWLATFWATRVARVERHGRRRVLRVIRPPGETYVFEIRGDGVRWLDEGS